MEMDLLGSFRNIRTGVGILFCLISIDVFATPPVPEWIRSRWVKSFQRETVQEVKDQSLIFHDPKCAPFLCLKQKEKRKITWNPEVMRELHSGEKPWDMDYVLEHFDEALTHDLELPGARTADSIRAERGAPTTPNA